MSQYYIHNSDTKFTVEIREQLGWHEFNIANNIEDAHKKIMDHFAQSTVGNRTRSYRIVETIKTQIDLKG